MALVGRANAATYRDVRRWNRPVYYYGSVEDMLRADLSRTGIHSAKIRTVILDAMVLNRQSRKTIISFHPAMNRRHLIKLPVFVGQNITGEDANVIMLSDPSLYYSDRLLLAWFAGSIDAPLQSILPGVLAKIASDLGSDQLIFTGVSGGGFAALSYSRCFPGSLAIPINPQTNIARFTRASVENYIYTCFGRDASVEEVLDNAIQSDLVSQYKFGFENYVLYLQNACDPHCHAHARPFFEALPPECSDRAKLVLSSDWGNGHIGPPGPVIASVLTAAVAAADHGAFVREFVLSDPRSAVALDNLPLDRNCSRDQNSPDRIGDPLQMLLERCRARAAGLIALVTPQKGREVESQRQGKASPMKTALRVITYVLFLIRPLSFRRKDR